MASTQKLSPRATAYTKQARSRSGSMSSNIQRSRCAAQRRGRCIGNPLDTTVLAPRSIRLPLLYQSRQVSKEMEKVEKQSLTMARDGQTQACLQVEASQGMLDKVEHLLKIFDVNNSGLLVFEDLCTLFSILAEKDWADFQRFTEWCKLLGVDPNRGLSVQSLCRLLSLEPTFVDDAFRLLGLEPTPSKFTALPGSLRVELLRAALDGSRTFASRLAGSWKSEYAHLLASVLSGVAVAPNSYVVHVIAIGTEVVDEALENLLIAMHEFIDATVSSVDRWHNCFTGYLKRAALDSCAEKWASFDATWGARIATLLAQVHSVEALRCEMNDAGAFTKVASTWRYALAVGALVPVLEEAAPHGLIPPVVQLTKMKGIAKYIRTGSWTEMSHSLVVQQRTPTPQLLAKPTGQQHKHKPVQPAPHAVGPRRQRNLRAAAYVKSLTQRASTNSAPSSPVARHREIGTPSSSKRAATAPGSKRVATAPVASSRYEHRPISSSPLAPPEAKCIDDGNDSRSMAQILLNQIRNTIGSPNEELIKNCVQPSPPDSSVQRSEISNTARHYEAKSSVGISASSHEGEDRVLEVPKSRKVLDEDNEGDLSGSYEKDSSWVGDLPTFGNGTSRTIDLDESTDVSTCMASDVLCTWHGDPIESLSQVSPRSLLMVESVELPESSLWPESCKASVDEVSSPTSSGRDRRAW